MKIYKRPLAGHHIRNTKNWKCKFCGKSFDTVQGLLIHLGKKQRKIERDGSGEKNLEEKWKKFDEIQKEKERLRKFYPK